ncbi:DUF4148 domain-containing protein [Paraburkholderia adhaesiva]|uniref:DUF4148 domain-containing protein n=1 Tax=Paraburkholderia adhaesiva TaxID=2883244 RepID=UPI001F209279|nr:DUF4148 domain-containing protein [Paraburkholderia adhaesiva]
MKSLIQAVAVAAALIVPVASYAQANSPITRAQVRAELEQLEKVGYHVGDGGDAHYPDAIQAAEARVAAANGNTGYGGVANGTSQAGGGVKVSQKDWDAMYSH